MNKLKNLSATIVAQIKQGRQKMTAAEPAHHRGRATFWALAILIAAGMTIPLVHFRPDKWDSSIVATWVQAYGSVFAIVGSIWIARSEALARRTDEIDNAKVTARYMSPTLVSIRGTLRAFKFEINIPKDACNDPDKEEIQSIDSKVKEMQTLILAMVRPTEDQLSKLRVAPATVQNSIFKCMASLVAIDALLREYFVIYDGHLGDDSRPTLKSTMNMLEDGDLFLRDACDELDKFAGSTELTKLLKQKLFITD